MNCSEIRERLSAFHDSELPLREQEAVAEHVSLCAACEKQWQDFQQLSAMAAHLPRPVPPLEIWGAIEASLNAERLGHTPLAIPTQRPGRRRLAVVGWGSIAIALAILIAAWGGIKSREAAIHQRHVASILNDVLEACAREDGSAEPLAPPDIRHKTITHAEVTTATKHRPLVADGLPEGYRVTSTTVTTTPHCVCVQCSCTRSDGTTLTILEHDVRGEEWFGDRPVSMCRCGDTSCQVAELDGTLAATWNVGQRALTVFGIRDQSELEHLVAWFDDRRRHHFP